MALLKSFSEWWSDKTTVKRGMSHKKLKTVFEFHEFGCAVVTLNFISGKYNLKKNNTSLFNLSFMEKRINVVCVICCVSRRT